MNRFLFILALFIGLCVSGLISTGLSQTGGGSVGGNPPFQLRRGSSNLTINASGTITYSVSGGSAVTLPANGVFGILCSGCTTDTLVKYDGSNLANSLLSESGSTEMLAGNLIPDTAGTRAVGSSSAPFAQVWIGSSATARTRLTSSASVQRLIGFPDLAGTVALTANTLGDFAVTTSAQLRGVLSDELGTGAALFDGATPTSFVLTNATGLPISTGVSGLGTGIVTFLGTPSSANLRAALTDENGTGVALFDGASNPTLAGLTSTIKIIGINGTASNPAFTFSSNTNSGIYNSGSGSVGVSVGGTNVATFSSTAFTLNAINETAPIVNATTGFQVNGAATSGNYLRGNGTNFVSSAIQSADLPATVNATTYQAGGATIYSSGTPAIAGNATLNTGSKDSSGKITSTGTGASTAVLTFSITFTRAPACFVTNETTSNLVRPISTTTTLTISATVVTGDSLSYICLGY